MERGLGRTTAGRGEGDEGEESCKNYILFRIFFLVFSCARVVTVDRPTRQSRIRASRSLFSVLTLIERGVLGVTGSCRGLAYACNPMRAERLNCALCVCFMFSKGKMCGEDRAGPCTQTASYLYKREGGWEVDGVLLLYLSRLIFLYTGAMQPGC